MEPRVKRLFENIEKEMDEVPDAVVIANATDPHLDYTFFYVTKLEVGRFEGSVAVLYPDGELTDEPEAVMIAELVREAALSGVRDELPHSIACVVEEIVPRSEGLPTSRCSTST